MSESLHHSVHNTIEYVNLPSEKSFLYWYKYFITQLCVLEVDLLWAIGASLNNWYQEKLAVILKIIHIHNIKYDVIFSGKQRFHLKYLFFTALEL